jgi:hypothetical protein
MNGGEEKEREEKKSQSDVSDPHAILHVRKVQVMETMSQKLMWARNLPIQGMASSPATSRFATSLARSATYNGAGAADDIFDPCVSLHAARCSGV